MLRPQVDLNATVKLIDFGFASWVAPGEKLTQVCGTYEFMAPDMFTHAGYSLPVDMWSSGVVLYVFLTGRVPGISTTIAAHVPARANFWESAQ